MQAYLINEDRGSVLGGFSSIKAARAVRDNAVFRAGIITLAPVSLAPYTKTELTSLYNSVSSTRNRVRSFRTRGDVMKRLTRALKNSDTQESTTDMRGPKTKDIEPLCTVDRLRPVQRDSRLGRMIAALHKGVTIEELAKAMKYPKAIIWRDHALKRKGYGRKKVGDKFYLVLPEGCTEPLFRD